jgi:hypothetical protein
MEIPQIYTINFEGGKIISHIKKSKYCIGYANIQIAMDAPYHGRVADETIRSNGRSETQFKDYNEKKLINKLVEIFKYIKNKDKKIIIQIARGRSADSMFNEVIKPILEKLKIIEYENKNGYRTSDYYNYKKIKQEFIFVNIGMIAILTNPKKIKVGEICNPIITYQIKNFDEDKQKFKINISKYEIFDEDKNILNNFNFKKIILYGIDDDMKFILPSIYSFSSIKKLISKTKKSLHKNLIEG